MTHSDEDILSEFEHHDAWNCSIYECWTDKELLIDWLRTTLESKDADREKAVEEALEKGRLCTRGQCPDNCEICSDLTPNISNDK